MSTPGVPDSLWLLGQARGTAILLRVLIACGGLLVIAATSAAASDDGFLPWMAGIALVLLFVCVVDPDGAAGAGLLAVSGAHWLLAVDDVTTPWAVVASIGLALTHIAAAASGVAPAGARWTPAMQRRWARRTAVVLPSALVTWVLVRVVDGRDIGASGPLVGVALLALAGALVWVRRASLD